MELSPMEVTLDSFVSTRDSLFLSPKTYLLMVHQQSKTLFVNSYWTEVAPLLCAGLTVFAPLKRYGVKLGSNVGELGIGGLGHLCVKLAAALGANVTALSHSAHKEKECREMGAANFILSSDKVKKTKIREIFKNLTLRKY